MKKIILSAMVLLTISSSCKKSSSSPAPVVCTLSSTSITGTYKVTSVIYKATTSSTGTDFIDTVFPKACQKDDNIIISTGTTLFYSDLATKCTPEGTITAAWNLTGSVFTVTGSGTGLDGKAQVIENFSCTGFQGTYSPNVTPGDKVIISYQKQ